MADEFRWPEDPVPGLRDGLTPTDVIEALFAPTTLRLDNRVPPAAPTMLAVCAPTEQLRLIVVVCVRSAPGEPWTIVGAREAGPNERAMWRKQTA